MATRALSNEAMAKFSELEREQHYKNRFWNIVLIPPFILMCVPIVGLIAMCDLYNGVFRLMARRVK